MPSSNAIKSTLGNIPVLLEHKDFFIIEKPSGLACHGPDSENLAALLKQAQFSNKLCHRLDKGSSGLVIIAKHVEAAEKFRVLFEENAINKYYLALSHRKGRKKQGSIKGDMEKARDGKWKLNKTKRENPAISHFYSFGSQDSENTERIFLIKIVGGKTHQIRVAMKANGSPILGDRLYGGQEATRLMLHASCLSFAYQGEQVRLYSQAPFISEHELRRLPQLFVPEDLEWPE